jgi:flagellin
MAMNDVSLTASMRSTLVSLQETTNTMNRTQERLSTGKKVNSALDNPANFFAAKGHTDRAGQLEGRKDAMNEAVQTIKAADKGVKAISTLIENLRGVVTQARAETSGTGATAAQVAQFSTLVAQMDTLVADASYKGVNFLQDGTTLKVSFNEDGSNSLTVSGSGATTTALSIGTLGSGETGATLDTLEDTLNTALTSLRENSATLASNLSIIQTRIDFTTDMVNTLKEGADKLTLADINEEGANMLMLQTRQQLGTTSLSLASQAAQGVLRLF